VTRVLNNKIVKLKEKYKFARDNQKSALFGATEEDIKISMEKKQKYHDLKERLK